MQLGSSLSLLRVMSYLLMLSTYNLLLVWQLLVSILKYKTSRLIYNHLKILYLCDPKLFIYLAMVLKITPQINFIYKLKINRKAKLVSKINSQNQELKSFFQEKKLLKISKSCLLQHVTQKILVKSSMNNVVYL